MVCCRGEWCKPALGSGEREIKTPVALRSRFPPRVGDARSVPSSVSVCRACRLYRGVPVGGTVCLKLGREMKKFPGCCCSWLSPGARPGRSDYLTSFEEFFVVGNLNGQQNWLVDAGNRRQHRWQRSHGHAVRPDDRAARSARRLRAWNVTSPGCRSAAVNPIVRAASDRQGGNPHPHDHRRP